MRIKFLTLMAAASAAMVLTACGGGGGGGGGGNSATPAAGTLGGTAAVGFPIVGGTVNVSCAGGSALTSPPTSSTGAWQVTLSGQTLPCAVQVNGGTINGAANSTKYHSIAISAGTVNVTPLTDLLVANLAGSTTPGAWFTGLTPAALAVINQAGVDTALTKLRTALSSLTPLSTINPITTAFTPVSGNNVDDMLEALKTAASNPGLDYPTLLNSASQSNFTAPSGLSAALTTAYANTSTGSTGGTGGNGSGGCTGDTAAFFTSYAGTHQVAAVTYDGGSGHPTVVGFVNGTTYTVVVNSNCTINVGALTLTYKPNSFFSSQGTSPTKMNTQAAMVNPAIVFGNFELPDGPPLLLQFSDPAATANSLMFSF